jgi:hypothetical protein
MANSTGKHIKAGTLRRPEPNRKKIGIIIAVIVVVSLSAWGGIHYMFKGSNDPNDLGRRRRQWRDANMPDPDKQTAKEIMDYRNSDQFKRLSQREQFMYSMASGQQVMDYQIDTYFTLPKEKQTAYLDKMIDDMQAQRKNFEQMRPPRRPRDANDPNVQKRIAARQAAMADPANARARAERGTALQRAQRQQFFAAMQARMQARGISMPAGPGGGGGGRGGFGGGPPGGGRGR